MIITAHILRDCGWIPAAQSEKEVQWLGQEFGVQWFKPTDDMSLSLLVKRVEQKAEKLNERIEELEELGSDEATDKLKATVAALEAKVKELEATGTVDPPAQNGTERNGITPPKSGATAKIWEIANVLNGTGAAPSRGNLVTAVRLAHPDIKEATAASCYSNWCRYQGINPKDPTKPWVAKEAPMAVTPPPPLPVVPAAEQPRVVCDTVFVEDGVQVIPPPAPIFFAPPPPPPYFPQA